MKKSVSIALLFCLSSPFLAAFELNPLFTDHMVLQRDIPARIFGTGAPGEKVTLGFRNHSAFATVQADGKWQITLPALPSSFEASGMSISCGNKSIEINDILIGDVWICSGQSNMGWGLWQSVPLPDSYPCARQLRLLKSKTPVASETPEDKLVIDPDFDNSWQQASEEYAKQFSAVAYYFGLDVTRQINVPIGLIQATLGGTGLQCWVPYETLKNHSDYDAFLQEYNREYEWALQNAKSPQVLQEYASKKPCFLFNGMINPLTNFPIKGMIWYQGERNAIMPETYRTLFPVAIAGWRKAWGQGDFPFFFVQLPGLFGENKWSQERTVFWPYLREAQEQALKLPNTAMAVTLDQGHYSDLHPKVKHTVGKRLALHAVAMEKKNFVSNGPIIENIEKNGNTACLTFTSVAGRLETRKVVLGRTAQNPDEDNAPFIVSAEKLSGFEVSGSDGVFHPANAKIVNYNCVELRSDDIDLIVDIRYAFAPFPLCNLFNSEGLPARPFRTDKQAFAETVPTKKKQNTQRPSRNSDNKISFSFPGINPDHKHMRMLIENSMRYIDPQNQMTEPVCGYPLEGWNHEPAKGLYLRAFTQLTAIGKWLELIANIAAGYADNPYVSQQDALEQAKLITKSMLEDQKDPAISAKGLLVNFIGLEDGKRIGPMVRDVEKKMIVKAFGEQQGEALWKALMEKGWINLQQKGQLGVITRGDSYGMDHFDGPMEPFGDPQTRKKIMEILDRRVAQIIFGDNANLSASVAKSIGALLRPEIADRPEITGLRTQLELFLKAQTEGYAYLYDNSTDTFIFGWNATDNRFYGWDSGQGEWIVGHMNYYISEFRGPELFVVLRYDLSENAVKNSGFKMNPYRMSDGSWRYTVSPWSGSAFQAMGLNLFMREMDNPAWKIIMENFVDIELDFAEKHRLPGFLSESYTGKGTQYTGDVGIPDLAVEAENRIIDAPSLYTLGVAYSISPEKIEAFLANNWPVISTLLTDHGPWEGYNTTNKQAIKYQTTAHTLSLILGAIRTGSDNMLRYLESLNLADRLEKLYAPGKPIDMLSGDTVLTAWTSDESHIKSGIKDGVFNVKASGGIKEGGVIFQIARDACFSNGQLTISYKSNAAVKKASLKFVRSKDDPIAPASIPNEIFLHLEKTAGPKQIDIPLPATPGLSAIRTIELNISETQEPVDLAFTSFTYKPYESGPEGRTGLSPLSKETIKGSSGAVEKVPCIPYNIILQERRNQFKHGG